MQLITSPARKARIAGATSSRFSASARLAMTKPILSPQSWRSPSKTRPWKGWRADQRRHRVGQLDLAAGALRRILPSTRMISGWRM